MSFKLFDLICNRVIATYPKITRDDVKVFLLGITLVPLFAVIMGTASERSKEALSHTHPVTTMVLSDTSIWLLQQFSWFSWVLYAIALLLIVFNIVLAFKIHPFILGFLPIVVMASGLIAVNTYLFDGYAEKLLFASGHPPTKYIVNK